MTPTDFYRTILAPAAEFCAPILAARDCPEARCMLLAIAGQESGWRNIHQDGGPAVDPWQHEIGSIRALKLNITTQRYMHSMARAVGCGTDPDSIYAALLGDMRLAYGCARLLLWTVPQPLPAIGDHTETLRQYRWTWRPGAWDTAPRALEAFQRWQRVYPQAAAAVQPEPAPAGATKED